MERWERETLAKSARYIGRAREWARLEELISGFLARPERHPVPVIGIRADGGMGKSRMVHEFLMRGPSPRGLVLRGKTISYTAAPYWVFATVLKHLMGAGEGDPVETVRRKWEALLERLRGFELLPEDQRAESRARLDEHEDYLAYLLGVAREPQRIGQVRPARLKELFFESFRLGLEAASALPEGGPEASGLPGAG